MLAENEIDELTAHISDDRITAALEKHDDPEHPDAASVADIRELLAWLQKSTEEVWGQWMSNVRDGSTTVVSVNDDLVVFDTGEHDVVRRDLRECYDGDVPTDDVTLTVVSQVMHDVAETFSDRDWGHSYPYVALLPEDGLAGRDFTESYIQWLMSECGLSGGVALDYYMVELRGHSQNSWAKAAGKDQGTVSQNIKNAKHRVDY